MIVMGERSCMRMVVVEAAETAHQDSGVDMGQLFQNVRLCTISVLVMLLPLTSELLSLHHIDACDLHFYLAHTRLCPRSAARTVYFLKNSERSRHHQLR
mmetsp:Transcript_14330/g.22097  ORF Transcript_14330/g.22097 Transcript_14330/m.22097 type:complete len:99 (-) Transcript_14330:733-1029(-)